MRRERGFVMADSLIALLVAALFLSTLFEICRLGLNSSANSERQLYAAVLAQSLLETASHTPASGHTFLHGHLYHWHLSVRRRPNLGQLRLKLQEVTVVVSWQHSGAEREFVLNTARIRGVS